MLLEIMKLKERITSTLTFEFDDTLPTKKLICNYGGMVALGEKKKKKKRPNFVSTKSFINT